VFPSGFLRVPRRGRPRPVRVRLPDPLRIREIPVPIREIRDLPLRIHLSHKLSRPSCIPIAAVIYTHGHPDHNGGTRAFAGADTPIYARVEHEKLLGEQRTPVSAAYRVRSIRQFGLALPPESPAHFLRINVKDLEVPVPPTVLVDAPRKSVNIAGVDLELVHAPGESIDQMAVWIASEGVLIAGDDIYPSFPNLYTIRGEPSRDVWRWAEVMDLLASFPAEHLVSGHGPPLSGKDTVHTALVAYGDAIQFVHDQTVRGINAGRTVDDIVADLRLPQHLASHPWLGELYGRVDWSARAIAASYIGFFGGDAADLHPLEPKARAERLVKLAKSGLDLTAAAKQALDAGDAQWAVELSASALDLAPGDAAATEVRAAALRKLAEIETSVNGINYYLTQAGETDGSLTVEDPIRNLSPEFVGAIPLEQVFASLRCRLDPVKSADVVQSVGFNFPDAAEQWQIDVRRGIAEVKRVETLTAPTQATMPAQAFKEMLIGQRIAALTMLTEAEVTGSLLDFKAVMGLFQ
jgi:alkyl sulfatase BDS1-like metallo-beta-lactamase superfamily hydrolase